MAYWAFGKIDSVSMFPSVRAIILQDSGAVMSWPWGTFNDAWITACNFWSLDPYVGVAMDSSEGSEFK